MTAVELSASGSAQYAYIDQDITRLAVKGGDYDLSAYIKGDAGWIGVSEQLDQGGGWRFGFARPALALDEALGHANAPIPADRFRCLDVDQSNIKSCRLYLRSRTSWEKVSRLFHIDDNAVKVWVNLAVQNPGKAQTKLNFDNVSLVYHQAQASAAPSLVAPANGATINDTTPTFTWQRRSGFGNSKVASYTFEVSKTNTTKTDGSFTSSLESLTRDFTSRTVRLDQGDGQYFWHVQAVNDSNQKSPWSEVWSFTLDSKRPGKIQLTDSIKIVSDDPANYSVTVKLDWTAVTTDVKYFAYWVGYNDDDFLTGNANNRGWVSVAVDQNTTTSVLLTLTKPRPALNKAFYTRVRAYDSAGNFSSVRGKDFILRNINDKIVIRNP